MYQSLANNNDSMRLAAIILMQATRNFQNVCYALGNNNNAIQYSIVDDLENNTKSLLCTITRNVAADDAMLSIQFSSDMKVWHDGIFLSDSLSSHKKNSISWKSNSINVDFKKQNFARLKIEIR